MVIFEFCLLNNTTMKTKQIIKTLLIFLLITSCKKEKVQTDNLFKYKEYVSYTTSGVISTAEQITVNLAKEVENWEAQQEISNEIIAIQPFVNGTIKTVNKHAFIFIPDEKLQADKEYTVTVKLGEIYKDIPEEFEDYTFQFKTIKPSFNVQTNNLQSYSKEWQYINGVIKSADVISINDAKSLVEASQNGKNLALVFNEVNEQSKFFEFKIDSINRTIDDSEILVKWNGKTIDAKNEGENTINIPGINNFTIVDVDVIQSPEQHLSINFSDPLKKQQNFDGLVTIQKVKNPKYVVDGNVLKVYPDSKLVGHIQVDVFQGIKNNSGYKLKKPFSETIAFEDLKPQVRLISNGTILPNSNALKFNFIRHSHIVYS